MVAQREQRRSPPIPLPGIPLTDTLAPLPPSSGVAARSVLRPTPVSTCGRTHAGGDPTVLGMTVTVAAELGQRALIAVELAGLLVGTGLIFWPDCPARAVT